MLVRETLGGFRDDYRHQGTGPEPEIKMTEQQYDEQSKRNVERWVAAHIIPVSPDAKDYRRSFTESQFRISLSDAPIAYDTLLDGKSVTFTPISGAKGSLDWSKVTLEDGIHIVGMKEVRS